MTKKTFYVKYYKVGLWRRMTIGGNIPFYALLSCYGTSGYEFHIYFLTPDSPNQPNVTNLANKFGRVFLPSDQFLWYLNFLQNEKPVYATINDVKPEWNGLHTSLEPIGEQEL